MACHLQIDADPIPDPAYHFDPDLDPWFHFDADPDLDPTFHYEILRGSFWSIGGFKSVEKVSGRIRIRIRIKLKVKIRIRVRIHNRMKNRIQIWIRIRLKVKSRIRIRIKVMRILNTDIYYNMEYYSINFCVGPDNMRVTFSQ